MNAPDAIKTKHADASTDVELYCMQCGYNLRGLAGDPKRCPECGKDNSLEVLLFPAARIARQLRFLEGAPTLTFAGLLLIGFGGLVLFSESPLSRVRNLEAAIVSASVPALLGLICCVLGTVRFAASCLHRPGWRSTLLRFQAYAAVIFIIGLVTVFGTILIPALGPFGTIFRPMNGLVTLTTLGIMWLVCVWSIRKLYRRTRAELEVLQREVAVAMYREEHNH
ncbi:MAG: hypothetical protein H6817_01120 [Phycisphaerales bacterium]|nr:hypothetical protein [Phycisphaerales bacterium]